MSFYYPFGMLQPERQFSSGKYRYGFNAMEKDDEVKGIGNSYDFGARIHDPRLARFLSVDPLTDEYPWLSPYLYAKNNPIAHIDIDGLNGGPPPVRGAKPNPVPRSSYIRNRQLYSQSRNAQKADFQKIVTRSIEKQFVLETSNYYRDILPTIQSTQYIRNLEGSAGPQSNTGFGELSYRAYSIYNQIQEYRELTDFQFTDANGRFSQEINSGFDFGTSQAGFRAFQQLKELQNTYNTAFKETMRVGLSDEEYNNLSSMEQTIRWLAAKEQLGPSPVEVVQVEIQKAVKSGAAPIKSKETKIPHQIRSSN